MKDFLTALILLVVLISFSFFVIQNGKTKEVLDVVTPTKLEIDLNNNKTVDRGESICINDIEAFSLAPNVEFFDKYSKIFNLNQNDMIGLGYLAQEYSTKLLKNKKVSVKFSGKETGECKYADVFLNGISYGQILANSGLGISKNNVNKDKFKDNLKKAKGLDLVILNHHSNKYHKLDCKYGKLAHDTVILPQKQLPENAVPCKFCHNKQIKNNKKFKYKKNFDLFEINNIPTPPLSITQGKLELLITDFTKHLKPNSNCSTSECKTVIKLIDGTKNSLDIALFGYDEVPEITKALVNAKNRGVKIRFVFDEYLDQSRNFYYDNSKIKDLSTQYTSDRIPSTAQSNYLMHNKFLIFDNLIVLTGSMNFSKTGLSGYDENNTVIIKSPEIAKLYTFEFEQMLSGKFHNQKQKLNLPNRFKLDDSTIEVYFSPQDTASSRIVQLVNSAKNYIYVPTFLITHSSISNALISAHKRGVDVKVILDANNVYTRNTKHDFLRKNGIPLKVENYAGKMHSKTMIIDDEYLILGSMNFSYSGENKNDENLLVIQNSKLAKYYRSFFEYLWLKIPDKYLKFNPKAESHDSIGSCSDGVDNNFNGKIDSAEVACKNI